MPKLKKTIGRVARRTIGSLGLEIKRKRPSSWRALSEFDDVSTVIDVGVARGTPELYEVFPHASLVLIDPLKECQKHVRSVLRDRNGIWLETALGSSPGEVEMNVEPDDIAKSSLLDRTSLTKSRNKIEKRQVPVKRLDDLAKENALSGPFALKIDTEGYELECLKGAEQTLTQTRVVALECSVKKRFHDSYEFEDLIDFMSARDFKLHSVLVARVDRQGTIRSLDLAFSRSELS